MTRQVMYAMPLSHRSQRQEAAEGPDGESEGQKEIWPKSHDSCHEKAVSFPVSLRNPTAPATTCFHWKISVFEKGKLTAKAFPTTLLGFSLQLRMHFFKMSFCLIICLFWLHQVLVTTHRIFALGWDT